MIALKQALGSTDRASYFQSFGEAFDEQTWYPDLNTWAKLGEDLYPTVVDIIGALTGGELVNGTEEDQCLFNHQFLHLSLINCAQSCQALKADLWDQSGYGNNKNPR